MSDEDKDDDKEEDEDEYDEEYPPIIIDNGTGFIRSGFASLTNDTPTSIITSVVGHSKLKDIEYSDTFIGDQAIAKGSKKVSLYRPIKHGNIINLDDMTRIWHYIFEHELQCMDDLEHSTIVLSEAPLNARINREKIIQTMFETFNVNKYYTQNTAVFELFSHGQTTGMVVGCGFNSCYTVPIYQGYALSHATNKMNIGGNDVNKQLHKTLGNHLDGMDSFVRFEVLETMKVSKCYVSEDYFTEMGIRETNIWKKRHIQKYGLPDGNEVVLGSNRFECGEIFFEPHLYGGHVVQKYKSICQYCYDSLLSVNVDVRKEIVSHIAIAGGGSLMNGFVERFSKELRLNVLPASMTKYHNVKYKQNRQNAAYIGASIFSTLDFFKDVCISQQEFEECGPNIVNRKCF